jgi:phage-related protein
VLPPKPIVWLHGEVRSPPFSHEARIEAGFLLRRLQNGEILSLPASRPLPGVGTKCHELRITDRDVIWRIVYYLASDAVVILEVFSKKTQTLPKPIADAAKRRLRDYQRLTKGD